MTERLWLFIFVCVIHSMSINFTIIKLLLWRDSSALGIQCALILLPPRFLWVFSTLHHGMMLGPCHTTSSASNVYFTVLPKTMHFFNRAAALWSLGLCKVCNPRKTGICTSGTTEHHQRLLHGHSSFTKSLLGENIIKIHGTGSGFLQGENMTFTTLIVHRSDLSPRATALASECVQRSIILPPPSLQSRQRYKETVLVDLPLKASSSSVIDSDSTHTLKALMLMIKP